MKLILLIVVLLFTPCSWAVTCTSINNTNIITMSDQVLRDRAGNRIGTISTASDGIQTARDRAGNRLGTYDPRTNVTRDRAGNRVGDGNLLGSLFK